MIGGTKPWKGKKTGKNCDSKTNWTGKLTEKNETFLRYLLKMEEKFDEIRACAIMQL